MERGSPTAVLFWCTHAASPCPPVFHGMLFCVFFSSSSGLVLPFVGQPLSYLPLSLWPWQEVIKAVYQNRVQVVAVYPNAAVRSPGRRYELPSVIALREYRPMAGGFPAFTRFNVFLRDDFSCQVSARRSLVELLYVPRCCLVFALFPSLCPGQLHSLPLSCCTLTKPCLPSGRLRLSFAVARETDRAPSRSPLRFCNHDVFIVSGPLLLSALGFLFGRPVLWPKVSFSGPHFRPRRAALPRRSEQLAERCRRVRQLQSSQGQPHNCPVEAVGRDGPPPRARPADKLAAADGGAALPAAVLPFDVEGLPLLGHGAYRVTDAQTCVPLFFCF